MQNSTTVWILLALISFSALVFVHKRCHGQAFPVMLIGFLLGGPLPWIGTCFCLMLYEAANKSAHRMVYRLSYWTFRPFEVFGDKQPIPHRIFIANLTATFAITGLLLAALFALLWAYEHRDEYI